MSPGFDISVNLLPIVELLSVWNRCYVFQESAEKEKDVCNKHIQKMLFASEQWAVKETTSVIGPKRGLSISDDS